MCYSLELSSDGSLDFSFVSVNLVSFVFWISCRLDYLFYWEIGQLAVLQVSKWISVGLQTKNLKREEKRGSKVEIYFNSSALLFRKQSFIWRSAKTGESDSDFVRYLTTRFPIFFQSKMHS